MRPSCDLLLTTIYARVDTSKSILGFRSHTHTPPDRYEVHTNRAFRVGHVGHCPWHGPSVNRRATAVSIELNVGPNVGHFFCTFCSFCSRPHAVSLRVITPDSERRVLPASGVVCGALPSRNARWSEDADSAVHNLGARGHHADQSPTLPALFIQEGVLC